MAQASHGVILIVDFGSQVTQLIARRVREAHVYCEIVPFDKAHIALKRLGRNLKGIILSGGPASVLDRGAPRACPLLFIAGVPILGICYGQQEMAYQLGGKVEAGHNREFGRAWVEMLMNSDLTNGVWPAGNGNVYQVWMSHGDRVVELPPGFVAFGKSENAPFAMIADAKRKFYGVQFHLEVVQTTCGDMIIGNFVRKVCGCDGSWTMANFREQAVKKIRKQVGNGKVICGLSGGVDSTVTAMLIHEAIPGQLVCVFVDNGLLRLNEASEVLALFRDHHNIPLVAVDAGERFLTALSGVSDPEQKRKIIGKLFVDVFAEEAKRIGNAKFLAQGTLYPDVIESVSVTGGPSVTIKSHHNVGGLPKQMKVKLVEPLRELFKDEVRVLGRELGLTETIVGRHPFPGPGLAIRIPGEVTQEKVLLLQLVDAIFIDEIRKAGLYDKIWQAYAALLPVKSVGVMGDERTYQYIAWLRAVTSVDGMTADFYPFKPDFLGRVTNRIVNEVKGINRVGYDYTSKPPGTIELE